uniref:sigma factor-like helix-turn-helix DNA-binding protein n=1 Tax=Mesorhizobium mediterraneum TaxID=43617 RepID=UPI0024A68828
PDERPGAEADMLAADDQHQVRRALAELPERQREAIVLQYYQELRTAMRQRSWGSASRHWKASCRGRGGSCAPGSDETGTK